MGEGAEAGRGLTRRRLLQDGAGAALGMGLASAGIDQLLASAAVASPKHGTLKDIEHVVILIQENRSFDHYFGTLSGVRGFDDKRGRKAFTQTGLDGKKQHPFHLATQCLPDLTHDWGPQHNSWNGGKMNGFLRAHEQADVPPSEPAGTGVETMGYYRRSDLPFYYALADAFTICDGYHCSVLGPTDPNRLMSMSAWIDPAGANGGPLVETLVATRASKLGTFTWTTMPERLSAKGISWKSYSAAGGGILDNPLTYFKSYYTNPALKAQGLSPIYPDDFMADLADNKLPQVSWIQTPILATEHPGYSGPESGEVATRAIVEALLSHPKTWKKTALFITWDENGGFFDHVAPPAAPHGTAGEYLTVPTLPPAAAGIRGPIGLGVRVPMLVVSPFSRGGLVCSDVFDHTSTLRFLETRFRVKVPNLSHWRRKVTGDLTSAFNFAAKPRVKRPHLPVAAPPASCASRPAPIPGKQPFPKQERGKRKRPSGRI